MYSLSFKYFRNTRGFENWEISLGYSPEGNFQPRDPFRSRPIARGRKYLMDYNGLSAMKAKPRILELQYPMTSPLFDN